ncbi:GPI transamidase component gaa1 [Termitomyces sp. T112]|nr:GPI transamidase component gaa1 [Termitomyces sp. T112]KAH0583733.1 hypothetical protein H2248_009338 [Termitomyces sp. 'cryptogamus']
MPAEREPPGDEPPVTLLKRIVLRIKQRLQKSRSDASVTRIRRRKAVVLFLARHLTWLRLTLFFVGYVWMLIIPSPKLGHRTYIDENALQPNQVNTYWNWNDVHNADLYLDGLEQLRDNNATSQQRAQFIVSELRKLGISSALQNYAFGASTGPMEGTNAYGILASPRASGNEAMVISASWFSRTGEGDGTLNLRGVATILALAEFLKRYSLWAKDIVVVVSDGYLEGMHAWLAAYHGSSQSNLNADRLVLPSGVIWTALNIDYPGHSFSHLGIFFEGLNGRLPNQDLLNSVQRISHKEGVSVIVYDHFNQPVPNSSPSFIPKSIRENVSAYMSQAKNIIRQFGYQAQGHPSGIHGLFHQFRIDAITIFAMPAAGPHGFHAIGRIIESTLRTTNNLLERLHASFFFYVLTGPDRFLKIGSYLPSAVLISVAMMFGGLRVWTDAACQTSDIINEKSEKEGLRRRRPILIVLGVMGATHVVGALLLSVVTSSQFIEYQEIASPAIFISFALLPLLALLVPPYHPTQNTSSLSAVLKAINLCFASAVVSIITVLNFPLAALLAITLGIPLSVSSSGPVTIRLVKYVGYVLLGLGWLLFGQENMLQAIWDWEVLFSWFAPFVCLMYVPLVLQAGLVCLLPPL